MKIGRAGLGPGEGRLLPWALCLALLLGAAGSALEAAKKRPDKDTGADPYADLVWPPPPNKARIKLDLVIRGRVDLEARSRLSRAIIGRSRSRLDWLIKPIGVAFDQQGRILVTDSANAALFRFDRENRRVDVIGTRSRVTLQRPLGVSVAPDGVAYVADGALRQILAFDGEGGLVKVYGAPGELSNPTDVVVSSDGARILVADSHAHRIHVYDRAAGRRLESFGRRGEGEGEFNFPTSLALDAEGSLYVVDQMNGRIQVFAEDGEYLDEFGGLGRGFGTFARPKDIAVDEVGFIYVTDNAFNNFQIFDIDFALLTFVGSGGRKPGAFDGASGIAVRGEEIAVVDQLGARIQVFRFIVPKDE